MTSQKGNALFLILIAVALFAALSYAVTSSSRGGGGIDKETARMQASILMQRAAHIERALKRIMLIGNYAPTHVEFQGSSTNFPGANNPNCSIDDCQIWTPEALGIEYDPPKTTWLAPDPGGDDRWGQYRVHTNDLDGIGDDDDCDAMLVVNYLSKDMCIAVNRIAGIEMAAGNPPRSINGLNTYGRYIHTNCGNELVDTNSALDGHYTGCFEIDTGGMYVFYHTMLVDY